jgi:hypothetical protein
MPGPDPTHLLRIRDGVYAPDLLTVAVVELDLFAWLESNGARLQARLCDEAWHRDRATYSSPISSP